MSSAFKRHCSKDLESSFYVLRTDRRIRPEILSRVHDLEPGAAGAGGGGAGLSGPGRARPGIQVRLQLHLKHTLQSRSEVPVQSFPQSQHTS